MDTETGEPGLSESKEKPKGLNGGEPLVNKQGDEGEVGDSCLTVLSGCREDGGVELILCELGKRGEDGEESKKGIGLSVLHFLPADSS